MLSPTYFLKFKNIILFLNRGLYFFSNGHTRNVVSTMPNVVKIDVENDNVLLTLSNVVQFHVEDLKITLIVQKGRFLLIHVLNMFLNQTIISQEMVKPSFTLDLFSLTLQNEKISSKEPLH